MELALASQLLRAWRDVCKVAKFHKVCVFAFRERALVRTAKLAILEWKEQAAESRTRERVRQELISRGDVGGMESRGSSRLARRRREIASVASTVREGTSSKNEKLDGKWIDEFSLCFIHPTLPRSS